MVTKKLILDFFADHKDELREKYSLVKVGLFGSYAKGSATPPKVILIFMLNLKIKSLETF